MAVIQLAYQNFQVPDDVDYKAITFGNQTPVLVSAVKSIAIIEKHTKERISTGADDRVYEIIMQFVPGALEVHIGIKKMVATNVSTIVDQNSTNVNLIRTNALPMAALPIFSRGAEVHYNIFLPSFGNAVGTALEIFSLRRSIDAGNIVRDEELKDDSTTLEFSSAAKVSTAGEVDQYDIITAYDQT